MGINFIQLKVENDAELQNLIVEDSENIEKGLRIVDRKIRMGERDFLDLLGVDSRKHLVIMKVKGREDGSMLMESLDCFDWVRNNIDTIRKMYPEHEIDCSQTPRVILIAPRFSYLFKRRVMFINLIKIDLFEYKYLEAKGERGLLFDPIDVPKSREYRERKSVDDHLNYILNDGVRALCKRAKDKIQRLSDKINVYATFAYIGFEFEDKHLATIHTEQDFFLVDTGIGKWTSIKVENEASFSKALHNVTTTFIELGGLKSDIQNLATHGSETEIELTHEEIVEFAQLARERADNKIAKG